MREKCNHDYKSDRVIMKLIINHFLGLENRSEEKAANLLHNFLAFPNQKSTKLKDQEMEITGQEQIGQILKN